MVTLKICVLIVAAASLVTTSLSAQADGCDVLARLDLQADTANSRQILESLADSLESLPDDQAAVPLALVRFRQGAGGEPHQFLRSQSLAEAALKDDFSSPCMWLVLGLSRARLGDAGYTGKLGLLQGYGEGYYGGAANAFLKVLELQPGNMAAVGALLTLVQDGRYPRDPAELLPYFDAAVAHQETLPEPYLAVVNLNVALGDYDAAEKVYEKYLTVGGDTVPIYVPDDRTPEQLLAEAGQRLSDLRKLYIFQTQLRISEGQFDSALTATERYAEAGGDSARYLFEKSRALFGQARNREAARAYYQGATRPQPTLDPYEQDIAWIADSSDLIEFESLPVSARADWLRDFWEARDVADARPFGVRLVEHRRRLRYANEHYRPSRVRRLGNFYSLYTALPGLTPTSDLELINPGDDQAPDFLSSPFAAIRSPGGSRQRVYSDMGAVYIRYGTPDDTASVPLTDAPLQFQPQVWRYDSPSRSLTLLFNGPFLVDQPRPDWDWMALCELEPVMCVRAGQRATGSLQLFDLKQDELRRQAEAEFVLSTDRNPVRFRTRLAPVVQMYGMPDGVLAVYALSADDLHKIDSSSTAGPTAYPLHLLLSAAEIDGKTRAQIDTTRILNVTAPLAGGEYISSVIELPVPPGAYLASMAISDTSDQSGAAVRLPHLEVPDFGSGELVMSDLILGKTGGLLWNSAGYEVHLNPLGAYQTGSSAELYYQVDGQEAGKSYRTSIAVIEGEDDEVISLEFRETAGSPRQWYQRSLGLARVSPGTYRVRVAITDMESGITISREQRLNVTR